MRLKTGAWFMRAMADAGRPKATRAKRIPLVRLRSDDWDDDEESGLSAIAAA